MFETPCAEEEILARLSALPSSVGAVEILRPSLDEIYAAFLRGAENGDLSAASPAAAQSLRPALSSVAAKPFEDPSTFGRMAPQAAADPGRSPGLSRPPP